MSVSAIDLTTGETVAVDSDRVLPTASVIKLPILIALLRAAENGEVDLGTRLTMRGDERVGGSGVLKPVSYTHLDVYKRQPQLTASSTRWRRVMYFRFVCPATAWPAWK